VTEPNVHVELRGIAKRFGGVSALSGIDLRIARGSVHALVGENGAGKSTLGRIIAGAHAPDAGTLSIDGAPVHFGSPRDALTHGITIIAQELTLVPARSVLENVFLGHETTRRGFVDRGPMRERYEALCARAGFDLRASDRVGDLRLADQQKVEILRALARDAQLIVMDEPTAALTGEEAQRLLAIMTGLRDQGTTIVFVSHFLEQVLAVADVATVLRDGGLVRTGPTAHETPGSLVTAMLGRSMGATFPPQTPPPADAPAVLAVRGLARRGVVHDVSLTVRAGEIVGLAGLVGAGRSEVARLIFGADRHDAGEIELDGVRLRIRAPRDAIRAGIAMLPESRKDQGLHVRSSILRNTSLVHLEEVTHAGVLALGEERRRVTAATEEVGVKAAGLGVPVSTLSGGNQQKVLFAKWLLHRPRLLIADEPTRGVDIGAKRTIYELLTALAAEGMAVLLISSEIEEVLGLAHRVLVMRGGRITAEFDGGDVTENDVLRAAFATEIVAA
jgi:simple sugar transport system ATP-binding protein/ribose transport system ATP-binding protein